MTLTVDDWGKMSVGDQTIDMTSGGAGPQGGHAKWTQESGDFNLKSGSYTLHVEQSNIDYDPKNKNLSICDYAFEAHVDKEGPPPAGGKKKPGCDCCSFDGNGAGCPPSAHTEIQKCCFCFWEHLLWRRKCTGNQRCFPDVLGCLASREEGAPCMNMVLMETSSRWKETRRRSIRSASPANIWMTTLG